MTSLLKEERYIFTLEAENHFLRVQEMIWGDYAWPEKFRVQVPASHAHRAKNIYGTTALKAAEAAAEYLTSPISPSEIILRAAGSSN